MSLLDLKESVKIEIICPMQWEASDVYVAPRPYHALVFRIKGNAIFTHKDKVVTASPGTVTYMPANYDYTAHYPDGNEIIVIHFYLEKELEIENFTPFSSVSVMTLFKNAHQIWSSGDECYYNKTMILFYEILCSLSPVDRPKRNSAAYKCFLSATEYMKENYTDANLSVESLAKSANISGTYFRRLFLEKYGETPLEYLTKLRLRHAESLLMARNCSIEEVALLSGFSDPKYFSRVVKKVYGCPPSHLYR